MSHAYCYLGRLQFNSTILLEKKALKGKANIVTRNCETISMNDWQNDLN